MSVTIEEALNISRAAAAKLKPAELTNDESNGELIVLELRRLGLPFTVDGVLQAIDSQLANLRWTKKPAKLVQLEADKKRDAAKLARLEADKKRDTLAALGIGLKEPTTSVTAKKTENNRTSFETSTATKKPVVTAQQQADADKAAKAASAERGAIDELASRYIATSNGRLDFGSKTESGRAKIKACTTYNDALNAYNALP
jgi:hypothetical protein